MTSRDGSCSELSLVSPPSYRVRGHDLRRRLGPRLCQSLATYWSGKWSGVKTGLTKLSRIQRILLVTLCFGIAVHLAASLLGSPLWDGALYSYMGGSISSSHSVTMAWDPGHSFPTWEYGIVYPLFLSAFYSILSYEVAVTLVGAFAASLILIGVGYWTTTDLFGLTKGLIVANLLSFDPTLLSSSSRGYADSFLLALFVFSAWALIKALREDRYMALFGLTAGLFYMTKTIIGWSYVVPGIAGLLAWRWWRARPSWRAFRWWVIGAFTVLGFVAFRETAVQLEGRVITAHDLSFAAANLGTLVPTAAVKLPFLLLMLGTYGVFWLPELRRALLSRREPTHETLLLAVFGLGSVVWALISVISITEPQNPVFWQDNMRYVLILVVPLLWLIFMHVDFDAPQPSIPDSALPTRYTVIGFLGLGGIAVGSLVMVGAWLAVFFGFGALSLLVRQRWKKLAVMLLVFAIAGANTLTVVDEPGFIAASTLLNARLRPGDVVAIDRHVPPDLNAVQLYNYIREHNITVVNYTATTNATFILSQIAPGDNISFPGYTLVGVFRGHYERTWLAQAVYLLRGSVPQIPGEELEVWQSNSTLVRGI